MVSILFVIKLFFLCFDVNVDLFWGIFINCQLDQKAILPDQHNYPRPPSRLSTKTMNRSSRIASVPHNGLPSHTTPTNRNIRQSRRPTLTEVLLHHHEPPQTSHPPLSGLATSSSFNSNYRNLPDTKARLAKATKLLNKFLEPYEEFYEDEEGALTEEDINKFMEKHKAMGLTDAECDEFMKKVFESSFKDGVTIDEYKMIKTFFKTLLSKKTKPTTYLD